MPLLYMLGIGFGAHLEQAGEVLWVILTRDKGLLGKRLELRTLVGVATDVGCGPTDVICSSTRGRHLGRSWNAYGTPLPNA